MSTPVRHAISFWTPGAAVATATLSNNRTLISGHWQEGPPRRLRPAQLLEKFVNCPPEPEAILGFTQKHGPLMRRQEGLGNDFSFAVSDWQLAQRELRDDWKHVKSSRREAPKSADAGLGERFSRTGGHLTYEALTLFRAFKLELWATAPQRLKRCAKPDCDHPYFVAHHLQQRYCSDACAIWAQQKWKRKWWHKTGDERRQQEKKEVQRGLFPDLEKGS